MSPFSKFGWFLYSLFALVAFIPIYVGIGTTLTRVLAERPAFALAFAANSLVDVTPRAPVRLYYGSKDLDVVPEEALAAARSMRARQVDAEAIDVGAVGHDASMLAAAPLILAWLRELDAK